MTSGSTERRDNRRWLWLTIPIALLVAIAAGGGLLIEGLYTDAPIWVAEAQGTDLISLIVVLPALLISAFFGARGSMRARLIWLGALSYLVYMYAIFSFSVQFNVLFLAYVGVFGFSLFAVIGGNSLIDQKQIKLYATGRLPVKSTSIFLGSLAAIFLALEMSEILGAISSGIIPQSVSDYGTPTNPVHVADLGWFLPSMAIAAIALWKRNPVGYLLAPVILTFLIFLNLSLLAGVPYKLAADLPVALPPMIAFGLFLVLSLVLLVAYLREIEAKGRAKLLFFHF